MLQEDRFLQIVNYLKEHNVATFIELANTTGASVGTIRRDLTQLEERGMLSIVRGGAVYHKDDLTKQIFDMRGIENREYKRALSQQLEEVITDGQAIALNSGTTNMEVARYLVEHYNRVTVLTNNMQIIDILKEAEGFTLIVPGGVLQNDEHSIFGEQCEQEIGMYNLDTALLAVNSISVEKGITDFRMEEVGIVRKMIEMAQTRIVVADHTKFDRISCMNVCSLSEIDCILTDDQVKQQQIERYEEQGVKILTPNKMGDS